MFDFANMEDNYEDRKRDSWTSEDGLSFVDTCLVSDGRKPYETAVNHPDYNNGMMIIVEAYDSVDEAQAGHDKWLKLMLEDNLPDVLTDCVNSEISQMCKDAGSIMNFPKKGGIK